MKIRSPVAPCRRKCRRTARRYTSPCRRERNALSRGSTEWAARASSPEPGRLHSSMTRWPCGEIRSMPSPTGAASNRSWTNFLHQAIADTSRGSVRSALVSITDGGSENRNLASVPLRPKVSFEASSRSTSGCGLTAIASSGRSIIPSSRVALAGECGSPSCDLFSRSRFGTPFPYRIPVTVSSSPGLASLRSRSHRPPPLGGISQASGRPRRRTREGLLLPVYVPREAPAQADRRGLRAPRLVE
jgi:hypothetical protein